MAVFLFIELFGYVLEIALLCRLIRWRAWRYYPIFFAFYLYLFVRFLLVTYVTHTNGLTEQQYIFWYWTTSAFAALLWFPLCWEILRGILGNHPLILRVGGWALVMVMLGLAAFYQFADWPGLYRLPDVQRKAAMTATVWIVIVLLLCRYYGIVPSRNIWGIAMGQGLFTAISLINFAAIGIDENFYPFFRYVRPLSFTATLIIWVWALWNYYPPPGIPAPAVPDPSTTAKAAVSWDRVKEAIRKSLGL